MGKRDKYMNRNGGNGLETVQHEEPEVMAPVPAVTPPPLPEPEKTSVADVLATLPPEAQAAVNAALNPEEISEPLLVLRLALIEERITRTNIDRVYKRLLYDLKLRDLRNEAKMIDNELELQGTRNRGELAAIKKDIEAKYDIKLQEYGYDEDTGKLTKLPPGAVSKKPETLQ